MFVLKLHLKNWKHPVNFIFCIIKLGNSGYSDDSGYFGMNDQICEVIIA